MGRRSRVSPPLPQVRAAAGYATVRSPGSLGTYVVGAATERALSVPTISRARDLIVSMVGSLNLSEKVKTWTGERFEMIPVEPRSWLDRPDPNVTRAFIIAETVSDLFFHGRAFWAVTSRYANGFPASFTWLPHDNVNTADQAGPAWFGPSRDITFNGHRLNPADIVQFLGTINGVLYQGSRAIDIAVRLDTAARRFASNEIAAGYLQQTGGEPMSGPELEELASAWAASRANNAIGALNEYVKWVEFDSNPNTLQLTEGRQHSALELARVANIPPYLVGVPVGGMTYQNAQQARSDLFWFAAMPYARVIEETLSGPNVTPRGHLIEFDTEEFRQVAEITEPINEPAAADRGTTPAAT